MQVIFDRQDLQAAVKGSLIALVATMGNLHRGHINLLTKALELKASKGAKVMASIFVNPMQFGANEDLDKYPRTLDADLAKLEEAGCDLVFVPEVAEIYPDGVENHTRIRVPKLSEGLCAKSRPTHFEGVASLVAKLLLLTKADYAIFGEKDYQQLALIKKMVQDLCIPTHIIAAPTVREESGLALSSRNGYLSAQELALAPELYLQLQNLSKNLQKAQLFGENFAPEKIQQYLKATEKTLNQGQWRLDYLELRDQKLEEVSKDSQDLILLAAAYLGKTRLLDNIKFTTD